MFDIEPDDAVRISLYRDRAHHHLGIGDFHELDMITDEHVLFHARDMLSGCRPVPNVERCSLDPVSRALLAHAGADPDATEALVAASRGLGVIDQDGERWALFETASGPDGVVKVREARVDTGPLTWVARGADWSLRVEHPMPATIRAAAVGRALGSIVSHPALDALPLVVVAVTSRHFGVALRP